jgi:hypothetical protein
MGTDEAHISKGDAPYLVGENQKLDYRKSLLRYQYPDTITLAVFVGRLLK